MGQSSKKQRTAQGTKEGSLAPLPRNPTFSAWAPVLRKVFAITLGGLGLAGVGALSMAQPSHPSGPASPSTTAALANLAPGVEWLAGAAPSEATSGVPSSERSEVAPPCPPPADVGSKRTAPGEPAVEVPNSTSGSGILGDGRVVLNVASPAELTTLPGIGQKRAEAIVALRTRSKGFRKISDLLRVKGIGVKSLRKLEPKLVLDAPTQTH